MNTAAPWLMLPVFATAHTATPVEIVLARFAFGRVYVVVHERPSYSRRQQELTAPNHHIGFAGSFGDYGGNSTVASTVVLEVNAAVRGGNSVQITMASPIRKSHLPQYTPLVPEQGGAPTSHGVQYQSPFV